MPWKNITSCHFPPADKQTKDVYGIPIGRSGNDLVALRKCLNWFLTLVLLLSCCPWLPMPVRAETEGLFEYTVIAGQRANIIGCDRSINGDVTLPATLGGYPVRAISGFAFSYCDDLISVTIPEGYQFIDTNAFTRCSRLESVTIPRSVEGIGSGAFRYCTSLSGIFVHTGNANYSSDTQGVLFNKKKTTLYRYPLAVSGSYTIPDSIKTIDSFSFEGCSSLTGVDIPTSVTTIEDYAFDSCNALTSVTIPKSVTLIDRGAFRYCKNLAAIWVASGNSKYSSDDRGVLFNKNKTTLIHAPGALSGSYTVPTGVATLGYGAFESCENLISVTLPDSLTVISEFAFSGCLELSSVNIPQRVTTIGDWALENCPKLTTIQLPASVVTVGEGIFAGCETLSGIWVDADNPKFSNDTLGVLFNKDKTQLVICPGGLSDSYAVPAGVNTIGKYAFYWCHRLQSVTLPKGLTSIEEAAFNHCWNMKAISIPVSVTTIGESAFYACDNLTDVYYGGAEANWRQIAVASYNTELTNANIHFETPIPEEPGQPEIPDLPAEPDAPGNLDGNGFLNEDDAIYLLQHVLLPEMFPVTQDVDFDNSGTVNEDDAIYLLQHILMPNTFPLI